MAVLRRNRSSDPSAMDSMTYRLRQPQGTINVPIGLVHSKNLGGRPSDLDCNNRKRCSEKNRCSFSLRCFESRTAIARKRVSSENGRDMCRSVAEHTSVDFWLNPSPNKASVKQRARGRWCSGPTSHRHEVWLSCDSQTAAVRLQRCDAHATTEQSLAGRWNHRSGQGGLQRRGPPSAQPRTQAERLSACRSAECDRRLA